MTGGHRSHYTKNAHHGRRTTIDAAASTRSRAFPTALSVRSRAAPKATASDSAVSRRSRTSTARGALLRKTSDDTTDIAEQLLRDIHEVWPADQPFIATMDLLFKLTALVERPWETISRGNPMKARKLAYLLKEFGIYSRSSNGAIRGYDRERFHDVWVRYGVVPEGEVEPSIRHTTNKGGAA